ncbi:DNA repair protein RecN [Bacteroidia bacterium]|nr:DNA repair protein RecN [Bacteroidia bacterium]GHT81446.1 DNA repair protein RecN [Bacteroidia bacterium]
MLQKLHIENYALIDHLDINFEDGLSTITGETGAGKSILLGALGVLLGQRADIATLRNKENSCIIEGEFQVDNKEMKQLFADNDIDFCLPTIVRRSIAPNGKSRAFVNDVPVTLAVLKDIGEMLIDVHSQHQNLLLQNADFQLKVVDSLTNNKTLLEEYRTLFLQLKQAKQTLDTLEEQSRLSKNDIDYYAHLFKELDEVQLQPDEQESLESEQQQLTYAEDIKASFAGVATLLNADNVCTTSLLKEAENTLEKISNVFEKASLLTVRLQSALIEIRDIANEVESIAESTEVNPARLSEVSERLDAIYMLQKKHKVNSIAELLTIHSELSQKINFVDNIDERLDAARKEYQRLQTQAKTLAQKITDARTKVFPAIVSHVTSMLSELGIPNATFKISHQFIDNLTVAGQDSIDFLFSANKGINVQDIVKVASGGEIARLMLSLKSLIAWTGDLPTIIFDEIDTGVSGEIADKMGEIIAELGKSIQVINITHLPQIASKGNAHYWVYKTENERDTTTHIKKLNEQERITEIAKMLSGQTLTDAAIKNAKELLKK